MPARWAARSASSTCLAISRLGSTAGARFEPIAQSLAFYQLHHKIIGTDVVEGADMWMIEGRDRPSLPFETRAKPFLGNLDGDLATEPGIQSPIYLTHAAGT